MILTKDAIQSLQVTFSKLFEQGWGEAAEWGSRLATTVPSSTRSNTYGWMARIPSMRKWLGPRLIQNLNTHRYQLENEPFELTIGVDRDDIEDDMLGVYDPLMREMGRAARKWPDQTLKTVLQAGTTGLGFDDVAFFSATHPLDPAGNQQNNFTSSALSDTTFDTVRSAMRSYTGEDGEPLGIDPRLLIVPPQLEKTANEIVMAERNSSGATNVLRGTAEVLVVPELANEPTVWYLADVSRGIKPLVWQLRKAVEMVSRTNVTDDNVFEKRQYEWGVDSRGNAGYGPWFLIARAVA